METRSNKPLRHMDLRSRFHEALRSEIGADLAFRHAACRTRGTAAGRPAAHGGRSATGAPSCSRRASETRRRAAPPEEPCGRVRMPSSRRVEVEHRMPSRSGTIRRAVRAAPLAALTLWAAAAPLAARTGPAIGTGGLRADTTPTAAAPRRLTDTLLEPFRYRFIGPSNPSGRVTAIAVPDTAGHRIAYAGLASGGVWKTTERRHDLDVRVRPRRELLGGRHRRGPVEPSGGLGRHRRAQLPALPDLGRRCLPLRRRRARPGRTWA